MKLIGLVLLICSIDVFAHGSSHIYHLREQIDDEGQLYLECHEVTITTSSGFNLHTYGNSWRPDYIVTKEGYRRLQSLINTKCGKYNEYLFELYPDEIEGNFYDDNRGITR